MNTFTEKSALVFPKVRFLDIYMAGHNGYIAGGCFKNIFEKIRIKDLDIFFQNENDFAAANVYYKSNQDYDFVYENPKVTSYKNKKTGIRIELIQKSYGTPEEMLSKFDFSIAKFAYIKKESINEDGSKSLEYKCFFHADYFEHLVCKKLVLEKEILFPISTFERSLRYTKYGYGLCRESKENLLNALKVENVSDISQSLYDGID
jgi:hypothetical protein